MTSKKPSYKLGKLKNKSPLASVTPYHGVYPQIPDSVFLGDGARIIGDVKFGEHASIWHNAVIRADVHSIHIGENSNIQDGACLHCTYQKNKTIVGKNVSIGHMAIVHGCEIKDNCLIGMGAIIMDKAVIGEGSLVGAGALVSTGTIVPPNSLVIGSPARVVRQVTPAEFTSFTQTTLRYLEYAKGYDYSSEEKR